MELTQQATLYTGSQTAVVNWVTNPDATSTYKIIDWSLAADSPALGTGADAAGSPNTSVNIGAKLDYVTNDTDSRKHNFLQQAHDHAGFGAGDTVTIHTV